MDDERLSWAARLALTLLACSFVVLFCFAVFAHEALLGWQYDALCCSNRDCAQSQTNDIRETPDGFVIAATGEVIPYSDGRVKRSRDEHFHRCSIGGKPEATTLCIYVPDRGF